jgi:hypothetical protein
MLLATCFGIFTIVVSMLKLMLISLICGWSEGYGYLPVVAFTAQLIMPCVATDTVVCMLMYAGSNAAA